eukprot:9504187-Pyramimonas_sp.AAC.2
MSKYPKAAQEDARGAKEKKTTSHEELSVLKRVLEPCRGPGGAPKDLKKVSRCRKRPPGTWNNSHKRYPDVP